MHSKMAGLGARIREWLMFSFSGERLRQARRATNRTWLFFASHLWVHQSIVGLTIFIILTNTLVAKAAAEIPSLPSVISDPHQIAETVRVIAPYTTNIDEDPEAIALSLEEQVSGSFVRPTQVIATQEAVPEEPVLSAPAGQQPPAEKRTKDTKYSVKIGDTLSGIGTQFGLKIATLKVKNNLADVDSIKPGQELTIPPEDLSEKAIRAAEERRTASRGLSDQRRKKSGLAVKGGGYGLALPIRHQGITRGLTGGHTGIDFRADLGTTVTAADDGVVVVADGYGWNGGFGGNIALDHGGGKVTRYAHLSKVAVKGGARVEQGEIIGYSGSSGRSTGPHLHFELRIDGVPRNPF